MIEETIKQAKVLLGMFPDKDRSSSDGLLGVIYKLLKIVEWQPIETAKKDGTWYELLFEGDDESPNHFENGLQIYHGYHSLRAWRTKDHVTGNPKY